MIDIIKALNKFVENGVLYVLESDIFKLNLSSGETKKIILILKRQGIFIRRDLKESNYDYYLTESEYVENILYDETIPPKIATIKYDNANIPIYDFHNLENYIEKKLIFRYLILFKDNERNLDYIGYINLKHITYLGFNYEEIKFIFNYLDKKKIIIKGNSKVFISEFSNYHYSSRKSDNLLKHPKEFDYNHQLELLQEYKLVKDLKIRNEIIEENIRLINYILSRIKVKYKINPDEYFSYGCEGLILAIETFNFDLGIKFTTYAYQNIKYAIFKAMREDLLGLKQFHLKYLEYKKLIEEIYGVSLENNLYLVEEVLDLLEEDKIIDFKNRDNYRKKIIETFHYNVDDYLDEEIFIDYKDLYYDIDLKILDEKIVDLLDILDEDAKEIIKWYYGIGRNSLNMREIANLRNCSYQRISQIIMNSLRKMYGYINSKRWNDLYDQELFENLSFKFTK